jgi:hypothetical protein
MWVVAAGLRVCEVVALKVTPDAIGRFVHFFQAPGSAAALAGQRERVATINAARL